MTHELARPRRLGALTAILAVVVALPALSLIPAPAAVAEEPATEYTGTPPLTEGDPTWDGLEVPADVLDPGTALAAPQSSSPPALKTNAITAGITTLDGKTTYAATRTATPAKLLINATDGATKTQNLPRGEGAWDMALSGTTLAIGIAAAPSARSTWVSGFDTAKQQFTRHVELSGAGIVMALIEDTVNAAPGNGRYFWAGTYHSTGAKLFRVDLQRGTATDFTPRTGWQSFKYVRSLAADASGLTIGLGTPGGVWRLGADRTLQQRPQQWKAANAPVAKTSFAYSAAGTSGDTGLSLIGTEHPASLVATATSGAAVANHSVPSSTTIDRIAIDEVQRRAWFTTRPHGKLFSWDLDDPQSAPVERATPVAGSETRALQVSSRTEEVDEDEGSESGDLEAPAPPTSRVVETVRGVTGTGDPWTVEVNDGQVGEQRVHDVIVKPGQESRDTAVQGVTSFGGNTLVSGHWRYQVHGNADRQSITLPGEPKAQTVVGDSLYTALYPSATVYRLDSGLAVEKIADIGNAQMRPADIEYHPELDRLGVATGPAYGKYGGGVSLVDPSGAEQPRVFTRPVGDHQVGALAPQADGFLLGTTTLGEAKPSRGTAQLRYWKPQGDGRTGTTVWSKTLPVAADRVTGLQVISDAAGEFAVASVTVSGNITGRWESWLVAFDTSRKGEVLWKQRMGSYITSLEQSRGYLTAVIDGRVRQIGATRSAVTSVPVRGITPAAQVSHASLQVRSDAVQHVAYATSGTQGTAGTATQGVPRTAFRTAGDDRYATAVAVSRDTYRHAETVVLARGDDFADALAAGPLAAALDAPILLVRPGGLIGPETRAEIARLGAKRALPIGGTGAIPNSARSGLPSGTQLDNARRPSGADRYGTSVAVAQLLESTLGHRVDVMAATGLDFADAIAAVPAAVVSERAIVLYDDSAAARPSANFMRGRSVEALGGPAANALRKNGVSVATRVVGQDRYDTAARIARLHFPTTTDAYLAPGLSFPDGLTAGATAGRRGAPLFLAQQNALTGPTESAIRNGYGTQRLNLVGGVGVLAPGLETRTRDLR